MKVEPGKLFVSVKNRTGGLVFFRDNIETHFRVEPFNYNEKKIIKVKKGSLLPYSFFFHGANLTTDKESVCWFECNKKGVEK